MFPMTIFNPITLSSAFLSDNPVSWLQLFMFLNACYLRGEILCVFIEQSSKKDSSWPLMGHMPISGTIRVERGLGCYAWPGYCHLLNPVVWRLGGLSEPTGDSELHWVGKFCSLRETDYWELDNRCPLCYQKPMKGRYCFSYFRGSERLICQNSYGQ